MSTPAAQLRGDVSPGVTEQTDDGGSAPLRPVGPQDDAAIPGSKHSLLFLGSFVFFSNYLHSFLLPEGRGEPGGPGGPGPAAQRAPGVRFWFWTGKQAEPYPWKPTLIHLQQKHDFRFLCFPTVPEVPAAFTEPRKIKLFTSHRSAQRVNM